MAFVEAQTIKETPQYKIVFEANGIRYFSEYGTYQEGEIVILDIQNQIGLTYGDSFLKAIAVVDDFPIGEEIYVNVKAFPSLLRKYSEPPLLEMD